ncbi:MAG: hypothetical protein ACI9UT_000632 [Flavobacteriales bacterium]|jgi:hypothetical protein
MLNRCPNRMLRIVITFKSIDDWGKLITDHQTIRAER